MAKGTRNQKKPKEARGSRRGWAEGKREEVLQQFLAWYTQAITGPNPQNAAEEVLRDVYSTYFFHFPWDKDDIWEPSTLAVYDPNALVEPEVLSEEEQIRKRKVMKEKKEVRGRCPSRFLI